MRDHPKGAALLSIAQKVMRERIVSLLPAEVKHEALMVLNAMSIAARQLEQGDTAERQELRGLESLLCSVPTEASDIAELQSLLVAANHTLVQKIRAGSSEPESAQRANQYEHLMLVAHQRVSESNPKYLNK